MFSAGDRVRRISHSARPLAVGDEGVIIRVTLSGSLEIRWDKQAINEVYRDNRFAPEYFELVTEEEPEVFDV